MEYFNYFGSMITNDARCTSEIKSRTATAKGALNSNMTTLFTSKPDLKLKEETSNVLHLEHSFAQYWNVDTSESRSEIPGKFWKTELEEDIEDQLEQSCEQ